jgi:predicted metalloprotease
MQWNQGRQGGNVEDRRGLGPAHIAGGGIGALVLAAVGYFVFGISPDQTLQAVNSVQGGEAQQQGVIGAPSDEAGRFVDVIATSADDVWSGMVRGYAPPKVVLYDAATGTACGAGQAAMGPFYCPNDRTVYLDLSFWQELETRFGAKGDFARAYVIAHEIGHHVQNLTGQMDRTGGLASRGATSGSVRLELQADCYAGVWAAHVGQASGGKVTLDAGDIEQGMAAASGVGDDTLQRQTGGRVAPDSFTHGTSAQRVKWLRRGYDSGDMATCDTFSGAI